MTTGAKEEVSKEDAGVAADIAIFSYEQLVKRTSTQKIEESAYAMHMHTLMKGNCYIPKAGCGTVCVGAKNILHWARDHDDPAALINSCNYEETGKEIHVDFSDLGVDVVSGLCNLVESFMSDPEFDGNTLHIDLSGQYLGTPFNAMLTGASAWSPGAPSHTGESVDRHGPEMLRQCGHTGSWHKRQAEGVVGGAAKYYQMNRVFFNYENNGFASTETDEGVISAGGYIPARALNTDTAQFKTAEDNNRLGGINIKNQQDGATSIALEGVYSMPTTKTRGPDAGIKLDDHVRLDVTLDETGILRTAANQVGSDLDRNGKGTHSTTNGLHDNAGYIAAGVIGVLIMEGSVLYGFTRYGMADKTM